MRLIFFTFIFALASCTSQQSLEPKRQYENYIEDRLVTERLFNAGREVLTIKVLRANAELYTKQQAYTPGFTFRESKGAPKEDEIQFVVAWSLPGGEALTNSDVKFFLKNSSTGSDEQGSAEFSEVIDRAQIRILYPFAYPFMRVFIVTFRDFKQTPSGPFIVRTPVGSLSVAL